MVGLEKIQDIFLTEYALCAATVVAEKAPDPSRPFRATASRIAHGWMFLRGARSSFVINSETGETGASFSFRKVYRFTTKREPYSRFTAVFCARGGRMGRAVDSQQQ